MDERDRIIQSIEAGFLREMQELREDNAFLQSELNLVQRNRDRYVTLYEQLSQHYDLALEEIRKLQTRNEQLSQYYDFALEEIRKLQRVNVPEGV